MSEEWTGLSDLVTGIVTPGEKERWQRLPWVVSAALILFLIASTQTSDIPPWWMVAGMALSLSVGYFIIPHRASVRAAERMKAFMLDPEESGPYVDLIVDRMMTRALDQLVPAIVDRIFKKDQTSNAGNASVIARAAKKAAKEAKKLAKNAPKGTPLIPGATIRENLALQIASFAMPEEIAAYPALGAMGQKLLDGVAEMVLNSGTGEGDGGEFAEAPAPSSYDEDDDTGWS